jgi:hypothetical protein
MRIETRIAALEATVDSIGKALDDLRRRMDDGFRDVCRKSDEHYRELRAEIRDVRNEAKLDNRELRKDVDAKFRWLAGIQIATLIAVSGVLARVANLF